VIKERCQQVGKRLAVRLVGSRFNRRFIWATWAQTRTAAVRGFRGIFRGVAVQWDTVGHSWIVPIEVPGPAGGEVLVRTVASAVSIGTERAYYSLAPNVTASFPRRPGYSLVGEVWRVGPGVKHLAQGQLVAVQAGHASLAVVGLERVFPLPAGVGVETGAFIYLGIIALHGVWRGQMQPGERVAVLGRGPIGQLVVQLAHALGAAEVSSIAPTRLHHTSSIERFANRLVVTGEEGDGVLSTIQADVTYEVSGSPQAISDALRATRDGGRVVLLGSTRGITQGFDFGELADREITLVGAHISGLPQEGGPEPHNYRSAGETFLRLASEGTLDIPSLVNIQVNPWEASKFYRQLVEERTGWVGALFRWDQLEDRERLLPASYLTGPDMVMANGNKMSQTPLPLRLGSSEPPEPRSTRAKASNAQTPSEPTLRLAVVGCGARGSASAAEVMRAQHTSLAVVMDVNEGLARDLGKQLGVPWTTSYESVLADDGVDVVYINTPHHLHAEQALQAAAAGKHMIVEKPLAQDLAAAASIVRAAREADVVLSTWLGYRYRPEVVKAKAAIAAGALGRLQGATLTHHMHRPEFLRHRASSGGVADWSSRWESSGGGMLIMNSIHYLDWLLYLSGLKVKEVSARYTTHQDRLEVEDSIVMWLTLENDALATVNAFSHVQGLHQGGLLDCRMWGAEGHLSLAPPYQLYSTRPIDGKRADRWNSLDPLPKMGSPHIEYLERFSRAVLRGQQVDVTGEDGLQLQAVIEAAYRSSREGTHIQVEYPAA